MISSIVEQVQSVVESTDPEEKEVPSIPDSIDKKEMIASLAADNEDRKKKLLTFDPLEKSYEQSPFELESSIDEALNQFIDLKNTWVTEILINEAVIYETIFEAYDVSENEREEVFNKEGIPPGMHRGTPSSKKTFLQNQALKNEGETFIRDLPSIALEDADRMSLKENVLKDYKHIAKGTNVLRRLSDEYEVNPITIAHWIKESETVPEYHVEVYAQKFLLICTRDILMDDRDGMVPLLESVGEQTLQERMITYLMEEKGWNQNDIDCLEGYLGYKLDDYLLNCLFEDQCNLLNKFLYQPVSPYIWHLSSGPEQGFEALVIIDKWDRDRLILMKNRDLDKRREVLKRQLNNFAPESTGAKKSRETIRTQLREIDAFEEKVDDLLESGYDPVFDDGAEYNIAPLQQREMLKYDTLTESQLEAFLDDN